MRMSTGVVLVVAGAIGAIVIAKDFVFSGRNTESRQQHWESVLATSLKPGATVEDLQDFARANGQALSCFHERQMGDICTFSDPQSLGGTRSHPTRLAVIFKMEDDEVRSHEYTMVSAESPR